MKSISLLALALTASALSLPGGNYQAPLHGGRVGVVGKYLLELSPGETLWATEEEKWALRRVCLTELSPAEVLVANACGLIERSQLYGHHRYS
jgi:hypothetical protein